MSMNLSCGGILLHAEIDLLDRVRAEERCWVARTVQDNANTRARERSNCKTSAHTTSLVSRRSALPAPSRLRGAPPDCAGQEGASSRRQWDALTCRCADSHHERRVILQGCRQRRRLNERPQPGVGLAGGANRGRCCLPSRLRGPRREHCRRDPRLGAPLRDLGAFEERTTTADGDIWSGRYLYGRSTYLEFFGEGDNAPVGATGVALSPDLTGGLAIIEQRLRGTGPPDPARHRRVRRLDDDEVPWFETLSLTSEHDRSAIWVMEYDPAWFEDPRSGSGSAAGEADVSRRAILAGAYDVRRPLLDVVGRLDLRAHLVRTRPRPRAPVLQVRHPTIRGIAAQPLMHRLSSDPETTRHLHHRGAVQHLQHRPVPLLGHRDLPQHHAAPFAAIEQRKRAAEPPAQHPECQPPTGTTVAQEPEPGRTPSRTNRNRMVKHEPEPHTKL